MGRYILRRLLLLVPTLWAILTINFFLIQLAPGGPVEQMIAEMRGQGQNAFMERLSGTGIREVGSGDEPMTAKGTEGFYRGARGLDAEVIEQIKARFGFDKPIHIRYLNMLKDYASFQFGDSLFRAKGILPLLWERLPVSLSLGLWTTLLIYLVSIPLGIQKAVKHGSKFDVWSSTVVILGNAIPGFLFAIMLIILFAGGSYLDWFPLRGLVSDNWADLGFWGKIADYFWHITLPVIAMTIGGFATLTLLTKNSFLDEIGKQYVLTARAKGLTEKRILLGHVFRNAMLLIIAGFPASFISIFFTGSILIEVIFSLDGLGLLGYRAILQRDYPLIFSNLYIMTLVGLVMGLISDITYTLVDPRIDFERRRI